MSMPVIAAFKSANGICRLFETLIAATNWPKFLNPSVALLRSVPVGNTVFTRVMMPGLVETFAEIAFVGFQVVPVGVVPPDVVVGVVVVGVFDVVLGL